MYKEVSTMKEERKYNPAWEKLEDFLVEGDLKMFDEYKKESGFDSRYPAKTMVDNENFVQ